MNDNEPEYIRATYQSALEDIRFFKKQQWSVAYYTILLYGGIFALFELLNQIEFLAFIPGIVAALSVAILIQLHCSTENVRGRLNEIQKKIDENLHPIFGFGKTRQTNIDRYSVLVLLIVFIIGGSLLSIWAMLIRSSTVEESFITNYICLSPVTINSIGLILNFAGALFLLFFWIPIQVATKGILVNNKWELPKEDQKRIGRNNLLAKAGLIFMIIGFLLQLASNFV